MSASQKLKTNAEISYLPFLCFLSFWPWKKLSTYFLKHPSMSEWFPFCVSTLHFLVPRRSDVNSMKCLGGGERIQNFLPYPFSSSPDSFCNSFLFVFPFPVSFVFEACKIIVHFLLFFIEFPKARRWLGKACFIFTRTMSWEENFFHKITVKIRSRLFVALAIQFYFSFYFGSHSFSFISLSI